MKNLLNIIKENKGLISIIGGSILAATGLVMLKSQHVKAVKHEIAKQALEMKAVIDDCSENCSDEEYSEKDKLDDSIKVAAIVIRAMIKLLWIPYTIFLVGGVFTINGFFIVYKQKYMIKESVNYAC